GRSITTTSMRPRTSWPTRRRCSGSTPPPGSPTTSSASRDGAPPPRPGQAPLPDRHVEQPGQAPLRVGPRGGAQLAEYPVLRPQPERPGRGEGPPALGGEPPRPGPPVRIRDPLGDPVPLQEREAPGQRRLVDGEDVLELTQVGFPPPGDGGENAELGHPQTARSQHVVVELRHHPGGHAQRVAHAGGQARPRGPTRHRRAASYHATMLSASDVPGKALS